MSRGEKEMNIKNKWVLLKQRYQPKSTGQKKMSKRSADFTFSYDKLTQRRLTCNYFSYI